LGSNFTLAHDQAVTHQYHLHYPAHEPRTDDPHYPLFNAYRKAHIADAECSIGAQGPRFKATCVGGLELHHRIIEFAMQNGVDLQTFAAEFFPGQVVTQDQLMSWAESDPNFQFLCQMHHRGHSGVHVVSASDWNGVLYIPGIAY
jgi:hypothetical protein